MTPFRWMFWRLAWTRLGDRASAVSFDGGPWWRRVASGLYWRASGVRDAR